MDALKENTMAQKVMKINKYNAKQTQAFGYGCLENQWKEIKIDAFYKHYLSSFIHMMKVSVTFYNHCFIDKLNIIFLW